MLERLRIRNLALVDEAEVVFGSGLNCVTGETGAGKSLLVQSASLLMGVRGDAAYVREGANAAVIEGEFRLDAHSRARAAQLLEGWGIDSESETVIVRREVRADGRSRATVNQAAVTLSALRELGELLADLHGQHDHQSLLRPEAGIDMVDRLGRCDEVRAKYQSAFEAWRTAADHLNELQTALAKHGERHDWVVETARELDEAGLRDGEEEELRCESQRLRHADRLRGLVAEASAALSEADGSAIEQMGSAARAIEQAASLDPDLTTHLAGLDEARIAAAEASQALSQYATSLEGDPADLESIETRRELIARLTRKFKRDVPTLLDWREELRKELAVSDDAEGSLRDARNALTGAETACIKAARSLSARRRRSSAEWSRAITKELKPLGFKHASLDLQVETAEAEAGNLGPQGLDRVDIMFTANPGASARPLQRIASGGELSRVMLALKTALETQDRVDVLIFDEVDSGIGGSVAQAVGERLRKLARHRQIICVTHLPMIAALATHHVHVTKRVLAGRAQVRVEPLDADARVDELARMLAGDRASKTTRRQARELLDAIPGQGGP